MPKPSRQELGMECYVILFVMWGYVNGGMECFVRLLDNGNEIL